MAINPIPVMLVFAVAFVIQALVVVDDLDEANPDYAEAPDFSFSACSSIGGWDIVGDIIDCIQDSLGAFISFATFEPARAPTWLGIPLSLVLSGTIVVFILQMIRGN